MTKLKKLQTQILRDRGLQVSKAGVEKPYRHRRITASTKLPPGFHKTATMLLAEQQLGKPIEELLLEDNGAAIARKLKVNKSTIGRWIKKLEGVYSASNLPSCNDCKDATMHCLLGDCNKLNLWPHLKELKRREIMVHGNGSTEPQTAA